MSPGWWRKGWLLLVSLIPLGVGLLAALGWQMGLGPNPVWVLRLRADTGTLFLLAGVLLTLMTLPAAAVGVLAARRHAQDLAALQAAYTDAWHRFLGRLDHELKNPLTALRVGLAHLSALASGSERDVILESLQAQVTRLTRLTADLRKLAELERRPPERLPVDVGELLMEVVELFSGRRKILLTLPQAPWPLPPVVGDRDLLFLAFYNLLDNACKFTCPEDVVEVRAYENGRWVFIEVADTGPGIPEEDLPYIFEELYRGKNAQGIEGSGLGLTLVRVVVQQHGGHITVRSRRDEGTAFTVRLPLR